MIVVVLLALLLMLGIAAALGLTVDSRDPAYRFGPVIDPRQRCASSVHAEFNSERR